MKSNTFWKLTLIVGVLAWSLFNIFPLQDTDFDVYVEKTATAQKETFKDILAQAQTLVDNGTEQTMYMALGNLSNQQRIDLAQFFPNLDLADVKNLQRRNEIILAHLLKESQGQIKLGLDLEGGVAFTLKIDDQSLAGKEGYEKEQKLNKAIEIMSNRVNGLGVADPIIRAAGTNRIEVQLPGVSTKENPDALAALQKPAKLTFHKVHRTILPNESNENNPPLGFQLMVREDSNSSTGELYEEKLFIKKIPDMAGNLLKGAGVSLTEYGGYQINLNFTDKGTKRFKDITGQIARENESNKNLPENHPARTGRLAIVLDGKLYSAPSVSEEIPSGSARIQGQFSQRQAFELANVLNNPLEFELHVDEMYEIGPSLAADARSSSINAAIIGALLVVAFMLLYYVVPGIIAMISVLANIIIVLGVMASIQATLTLPGVAALVLTIGMAVDANILIFERIREELNLGASLKAALHSGFNKAFSTIVDANLTTLLTAIILIWLGSGPIKGFGVTLSIGIVATLFCALIISRLCLEFLVDKGILNNILKRCMFKERKIDFLKFAKPSFMISWVIVVIGLGLIAIKGKDIYGIDFLGGDEIAIEFSEKPSINKIYDLAKDEELGEVSAFFQTLIGEEKERLKIQTESGRGQEIFTALQKAIPEAELNLVGENHIGASVSGDIQLNALLAIAVAMLGILLYVAFRFEIGFGMGALVSTIHDILMTVGIFVMCGGQFTASMVAALLMIVGYSINDTIVVFDRIREELKLNPVTSLVKIINLSVNKTLSRTLLTSVTTLLSALALYLFGAGEINDFAFIFILGILTGTFSSIFIASPVFYWWHKGDRKSVEEKEATKKYDWDASSKAE